MNISPGLKTIMQNRSLTMQQRLTSFMMFAKLEELPDNPNWYDHSDTGNVISQMISEGKLQLHGFDENFRLKLAKQNV